jgi:hypothetical protein
MAHGASSDLSKRMTALDLLGLIWLQLRCMDDWHIGLASLSLIHGCACAEFRTYEMKTEMSTSDNGLT